MFRIPSAINKVINSFEQLPGIGPKTAGRLAYYLLLLPQSDLDAFAEAILNLKKQTRLCSVCYSIAENDPCNICSDQDRDQTIICVVENPLDIVAIERTNVFSGVYHVLHGVISPLRHIGPEDLYLNQLMDRLKTGEVKEVILATNNNLEGEATSMYIARSIQTLSDRGINISVSRLAKGLPVGGEIEYADEITLKRSLEGRKPI